MGDIVSLRGGVTPGQIISELAQRNPNVLACVERSADGQWRFSFSTMAPEDKVSCLGMLKVLEAALMGSLRAAVRETK